MHNINEIKISHTGLDGYIKSISCTSIGEIIPDVSIVAEDIDVYRITLSAYLPEDIKQDDWQVVTVPKFKPDYYWSPHLTPEDGNVIDMHVFRSPAMIMKNSQCSVCVIPGLNNSFYGKTRHYMDLDADNNKMVLGLSCTKVCDHVLYKKIPGAALPKGWFEFSFIVMVLTSKSHVENPFRRISAYLWSNFGSNAYDKLLPKPENMIKYVERTYDWAFNLWKDRVWQEFTLNGKRAGAPAFIVTVFQSPNYHSDHSEREALSVWNQAWFSSLRSAMGVYRYGKLTDNEELVEKALLTKELALLAPLDNGLFPAVIATEMKSIEADGKTYHRSCGWDTYYWGNSNRNPYTWSIKDSPYNILDMSWTAVLMLRWFNELEKDRRLLEYTLEYSEKLLELQYENGHFPSWLNKDTLKPCEFLNDSPQTSMSATFLLELYKITGENRYKEAALKAVDAVSRDIIPTGRWEDFETYWSCCRYGTDWLVGKRVSRNQMFKQCSFSMFFTAEALYEAYMATKDEKHLSQGQRCLDELLMMQSSWQPPYMHIPVVGGFGVMNCDGELNDSRQSLFAELIIKYGLLLNEKEYIERGAAAIRASFTMMYCPENPVVMEMWQRKWPFLGKEDYGFMMENYGHDGFEDTSGAGIGEFTIYDWGNGAASEAYLRILSHYGEKIFDK